MNLSFGTLSNRLVVYGALDEMPIGEELKREGLGASNVKPFDCP